LLAHRLLRHRLLGQRLLLLLLLLWLLLRLRLLLSGRLMTVVGRRCRGIGEEGSLHIPRVFRLI
jgi:hypothetical protein